MILSGEGEGTWVPKWQPRVAGFLCWKPSGQHGVLREEAIKPKTVGDLRVLLWCSVLGENALRLRERATSRSQTPPLALSSVLGPAFSKGLLQPSK